MAKRCDSSTTTDGRFEARYATSDFVFSKMVLTEREPEAGAILRKLGKTPTLDYRLVQLTYPGTTSYDDDERVDLKSEQLPDFLICKADRLMACAINEVAYDLPVSRIQGKHVRLIARIPDNESLFLERMDEQDLEVEPDDWIDLSGEGVERIYTRNAMVTVCLDKEGNKFELRRGRYSMQQLIAVFGLPLGKVLNYVDKNGKLTAFKDGESPQVFDGMKFYSHADSGGSS